MKLSILIVNWNSKDYLRECLGSIRDTCAEIAPQVVVVDGGSFDGSAEMISAEFGDVEFVQSDENIGFGRANNLGCHSVTSDYLLLLNPDTELYPGAVEVLLESLLQQPMAGMVGGRLLNSDGSLQHASVHSLPTPLNVALDSDWMRARWWRTKGPPDEGYPVEVEAVSGACMMMRAETFRSLGGFDPRYFMYAEDMDLCFKIRQSGGKIYHAPRAVLVHHGGGSSGTQFSKFSTVMIREAMRVYFWSNHGTLHAGLYRLLIGAAALIRIVLLSILWIASAGTGRKRRQVALSKWWVVLRWCLGLEAWAEERYFKSVESESLGAPANYPS